MQLEEEKRDQKISDHDALMSGKTQSGTKKKVEQVSDGGSQTRVFSHLLVVSINCS